MTTPRRIDTHQHVIPPAYRELLAARGERPGGIDLPTWSRAGALRVIRANHVEKAIVSVSTPGAWLGDAALARQVARDVNEYAADLVARDPDHFGFFATLTLPDVEGSLVELAYALDELHADGVILLANSDGRYLGDPQFVPLLAELDRRRTVVFVHPSELPGPAADGIPAFIADFLLDTTRSAISLVLSGSLDRFPHIPFILAHAGGFVPYVADRIMLGLLQRESAMHKAAAALAPEHAAAEHLRFLRHFYWDTALSASPAALHALTDIVDSSHVAFGTDWPFAPTPAVSYMTRAYEHYAMPASLRAGIDRDNALALFGR